MVVLAVDQDLKLSWFHSDNVQYIKFGMKFLEYIKDKMKSGCLGSLIWWPKIKVNEKSKVGMCQVKREVDLK